MNQQSQTTDPREDRSQRGSVGDHTEPRFLVIGQIAKPHGLRGDVRVIIHTDLPERFTWLDEVYIGENNPKRVPVEHAKFHKNLVILKLAGYDNRNQAESLRGQILQVSEDQAIPLEEDEYFLFQLIGLSVISEEGEHLGELIRVIETGANNVFVVRGPEKEILVPDIAEVVRDIDFDERQITIHLLPGLLST